MDQIKIGKFIAECRRKNDLTQMQLAEKLNITDRAVSKWENGRSLPDSSIMPELCDILGISLNDLFCGEVVTMDNYNKELEKNLIEMVKQKQEADKRLLLLEVFIGVLCSAILVAMAIIASYLQTEEWLRILLIVIGLIPFLVTLPFMLKIEQTAGYYECGKCHHRYVPTFSSIFRATHMGRTRYMKCPRCGKKSWQKKVITKEM